MFSLIEYAANFSAVTMDPKMSSCRASIQIVFFPTCTRYVRSARTAAASFDQRSALPTWKRADGCNTDTKKPALMQRLMA